VLAEGHRVIAAVRRAEAMQTLKQKYPDLLEVESVDVTSRDLVQAVAARHPTRAKAMEPFLAVSQMMLDGVRDGVLVNAPVAFLLTVIDLKRSLADAVMPD
jgi:NAD(P)-dependent dehydrogenase (short-subunit alcohol dehydrogenase family)